jgi:Putative transposase/Transposase zinc-binding domain
MTAATLPERPALEVADVIREYGEAFLDRSGGVLSAAQRKALRDLAACRTAALGGHVEHCLDCGHERIAYNSCRNRHCPKCQALARARWLQQQAEHLLPVEYHHVVFTLPAEVSDLALANPALLYDLLLRSAAATLREVAANPQRLGAVVGVLLVLHTWGQNLHHHPHVHGVVTGGGLSCDPAGTIDAAPRWVACRPGFFLPVRVLSRVFRGKFLDGLKGLFEQGRLVLPGRLQELAEPGGRVAWWKALYAKDWVVYSKPPFGGPEQVLKYLARYTHRVALSNSRLESLEGGRVTFRLKDYADGGRPKRLTLDALEFLRRFVQHVLPRGFVKVRHYGLLANGQRQARLAVCRRLLWAARVAAAVPGAAALPIEPAPARGCPECGGSRLVYRDLPPAPVPAGGDARPADSS